MRTPRPHRRGHRILLALSCLALSLWLFRINPGSPSAPTGLYLRSHRPPDVGRWVLVCLPTDISTYGKQRGYLWFRGALADCSDGSGQVLKRVAALPGDQVTVTQEPPRLQTPLATVPIFTADSQGRPMPRLAPQAHSVAPDQLWLLSTHIPNSWDSRYYGPVPVSSIRGTWSPLLTF